MNDDLQRAFYAIEAMRGPWSVRELQRQIDSNYYTRSGWSKKPELLSKRVNNKEHKPSFSEEIKSPYIFEFLGLQAKDTIGELDLEDALRQHLRDFILPTLLAQRAIFVQFRLFRVFSQSQKSIKLRKQCENSETSRKHH